MKNINQADTDKVIEDSECESYRVHGQVVNNIVCLNAFNILEKSFVNE